MNDLAAPVERSASLSNIDDRPRCRSWSAGTTVVRPAVERSRGDLAADHVERTPGLEPLDLLGTERVDGLEVDDRAIRLDDLAAHVHAGHRRQAEDVDPVVLLDQVVGGGV